MKNVSMNGSGYTWVQAITLSEYWVKGKGRDHTNGECLP